MLKIGLIGNVASLAPYVQTLKNFSHVKIAGKSSIGLRDQPAGDLLSIPEMPLQELIDQSDAILLDKSALLPFQKLKETVKLSRHLFIADFPDLSVDSCRELLKLSLEAGTIVQFRNPLVSNPVFHWLQQQWSEPIYLSLSEELPHLPDKKPFLARQLLLFRALFHAEPQKIRVSGLNHLPSGFWFINLRLDYSSNSTLNYELLVQQNNSHQLKAAMPGKFIEADIRLGTCRLNRQEVKPGKFIDDGLSDFLGRITSNTQPICGLEEYLGTLVTLEEINKKMTLYTPWHQ